MILQAVGATSEMRLHTGILAEIDLHRVDQMVKASDSTTSEVLNLYKSHHEHLEIVLSRKVIWHRPVREAAD